MTDQVLSVHNLPADIDPKDLAGSTVIVIDVLRATTTICQALSAGASDVVPLVDADEARAAAAAADAAVVLGGERAGGRISGFDLGNSPAEYTLETVRGRRVIITTTNGTRALHHARFARRVLVGAFVNLSAVIDAVEHDSRVDILCAGTDGGATFEDLLAAGAVVDHLRQRADAEWSLNEIAQAAQDEWQILEFVAERLGRSLKEQLALELRDTPGGVNLLGIGLDQDLVDCAQIDRLNIVPELDVPNWRITAQRIE